MSLGTNIKYSGSTKEKFMQNKETSCKSGLLYQWGSSHWNSKKDQDTEPFVARGTSLVLGYCIPGIQMILPDQREARQRCPRIRTFTGERTGTASLTPWHSICAFVLQHL
jgi:hypothetical protein